jgi:hypothetical protein
MADFARFVLAAQPALGAQPGEFLRAYEANRADAVVVVLESCPLAEPLQTIAASGFIGTASELLAQLASLVGDEMKKDRAWPKTARALSGVLRRLAPALRRVGIDVEFQPRTGAKRLITVRDVGEATVTTVTTVTGGSAETVVSGGEVTPGDANECSDGHFASVSKTAEGIDALVGQSVVCREHDHETKIATVRAGLVYLACGCYLRSRGGAVTGIVRPGRHLVDFVCDRCGFTVTAITLGDFDLYRKTITVLGKGQKKRLIPVSAELTTTVDEYMLTAYPLLERTPALADFLWYPVYRVGERVIGLKPEQKLSYRGFYEWWKRVEAVAGVRHRKPHMTRHTFATDILDATEGDLYAVKELLGHSSTRVTEVYLHSSRTRTASAVEALAAYRRRNRQTDEV